jgi:hypothetical protein
MHLVCYPLALFDSVYVAPSLVAGTVTELVVPVTRSTLPSKYLIVFTGLDPKQLFPFLPP